MESIQFGGRQVSGFAVGVGAVKDQRVFVRPAMDGADAVAGPVSRKVGAFVGGAIMSGIAGIVATSFFGDGANGLAGGVARLRRNLPSLAASAVVGGVVGAVTA